LLFPQLSHSHRRQGNRQDIFSVWLLHLYCVFAASWCLRSKELEQHFVQALRAPAQQRREARSRWRYGDISSRPSAHPASNILCYLIANLGQSTVLETGSVPVYAHIGAPAEKDFFINSESGRQILPSAENFLYEQGFLRCVNISEVLFK